MSEHASQPGIAFVIEPGTMADYRALRHWHYRSGEPRAAVLVLRAIVEKKTAGVLVVTMPVLNGRWRETAWSGWLGPHDRRERARLINAELRTAKQELERLTAGDPVGAATSE